ncbi:hypothetical protein CAEBREN_29448 [Caenorhabditis brenneri]|uniref:Innexin n=1 Tax=Caenorhabditis brenneri TaxID=135651 RepID=G0PFT6_CAEBE|nr:hypothetical protein CAEBREN_29448 [Caenorhabditis brenneri]
MALFYTLSTVWQAINAWIQFYILTQLLDSPLYSAWGPSILGDLIQGNDWQTTGHFPRVVHCDFNRRRPASVQVPYRNKKKSTVCGKSEGLIIMKLWKLGLHHVI